jgi:hypothetical protein
LRHDRYRCKDIFVDRSILAVELVFDANLNSFCSISPDKASQSSSEEIFQMRASEVAFIVIHLLCVVRGLSTGANRPKGCAAKPIDKKKIAVFGAGGYLGALTFGFLQRAASLYGTGIGSVRCIAATSDTALRLNRILSKNFCLAVADESYIKLTDLQSVEAIQQRLAGWDALILGNDLGILERVVTANTYELTPNDKAWEVYWDPPSSFGSLDANGKAVADERLKNVLMAARQAGVQHIVGVDSNGSLQARLEETNVPYTCIRPTGELGSITDYTFRKGVQGDLEVSLTDSSATPQMTSPVAIPREDLAALCVQSLLSLDWCQSRCLDLSCRGAAQAPGPVVLRPDQEWCVESRLLEIALSQVQSLQAMS